MINRFIGCSFLFLIALILTSACGNGSSSDDKNGRLFEKTSFQTASPWKPELDVCADVAIIYGCSDTPEMSFEERVKSWKEKGYKTHFMTGIAWGEYQDYFSGKWDGKTHPDEGQVDRWGDTIWHGPGVPYVVPTANFLKYIQQNHIRRAIDAGIDAIYLEEPEFWTRAGYSDAFKKEWADFYGFEWQAPHESAQNIYLANKLKYNLYYRALEECFTFAKTYGKSKKMDVRCYVPTHSLINYSQWQIVSPEASLASLDCVDGYIAQVWTGTARQPNQFNGSLRERVFETALLEYGCMESMTAPTGRKVFFLTDPIEDYPRDWADYRRNYQATFAAQLFYPDNNNYEVMPWPGRIYEGWYKTSAQSKKKERIPRDFSTQMQIMINSLNKMPVSENKISGSQGIGVLMNNSLMFQRTPDPIAGYSDDYFSNFFGLAFPFLKRGVPVHIVHQENIGYPETLKDTRILLMSYSNMKPLESDTHNQLASWVKNGGKIVYAGADSDPFQDIPEWWNEADRDYVAPSEHLFEKLGLSRNPEAGEYDVEKGSIVVFRNDPKEFVETIYGDSMLVQSVKHLYTSSNDTLRLTWKNHFKLERGPFEIISVLDESVSDASFIAKGAYIDLFDPNLPIVRKKEIFPGEQSLLFNLERIDEPEKPQVLASASRVFEESVAEDTYSFLARSPENTSNIMRIRLPDRPKKVRLKSIAHDKPVDAVSVWDRESKTFLLRFENEAEGVEVCLNW